MDLLVCFKVLLFNIYLSFIDNKVLTNEIFSVRWNYERGSDYESFSKQKEI